MGRKLIVVLAIMALTVAGTAATANAATPPPGVFGPALIKPDLTRGNALEIAVSDAYFFWAGQGFTENNFCNGEYENVRHKTQWACYGEFTEAPYPSSPYWQINLDPYGEVTYHHKGTV